MSENAGIHPFIEKKQEILERIRDLQLIDPNQEILTKLRKSLVALNYAQDEVDLIETVENPELNIYPPVIENEPSEINSKESVFIRIGDTHIPVVEKSINQARWKAVAGPIYTEGGRKWSKVLFQKRNPFGWSERLRPGDEIPFGSRKGQQLEAIDNILEGPKELRAFNEVLKKVCELEERYLELNPDNADYHVVASGFATRYKDILGLNTTDLNADQIDVLNKALPQELAAKLDLLDDPSGFAKRLAEILTTADFLTNTDDRESSHIPAIDPKFKMTPYFQDRFERLAQLINRQLGLGNNFMLDQMVNNNQQPDWLTLRAKGMAVIVGPRGAGKNKLGDHYCAVTQRALYRYACSPDKREPDLTYDVILKDGEVVRIPSRIIVAVTTPNAMLELDEVNLLDPAVAKFFNSLLDHDRAIFLNDQGIEAAPGVVILGLMNPADYQGVQDLPETIDDRSNAMTMDYPPFRTIDQQGAEHFTSDEALILKEHIHPISGMSDEKFTSLWNTVINGNAAGSGYEAQLVRIVLDLKDILLIVDKTRDIVKKYKTKIGSVKMERDISLRGSIAAAQFYSENHLWNWDINKVKDGYPAYFSVAAHAVAETYLPHTATYRKGNDDKNALMQILSVQLST